jgi:hypothetical protein
MENEIFGLDLPAGSLVPDLARPGFVCYRDAAGSDSKLLRRSRVPKPSALLPQLSRICFATGSSPRDLPDARAGPAMHPRNPGWKARKHPPVSSQFYSFLWASRRSEKQGRTNVRLPGRRHGTPAGLGVLAGRVPRTPTSRLVACRIASLGDPNTLEDDEDASDVRFDGVFRLLLLGHGPTVKLRRDTASTLLRDFRSHLADNAPGPCARGVQVS